VVPTSPVVPVIPVSFAVFPPTAPVYEGGVTR
jgi:hypothetical protein